jgi:serine/threonine-protein kinase
VSELLRVTAIDEDPATYLRQHSAVRREFSHLTQDSGNVSWLIDAAGVGLFVKTAGVDRPPQPGAPVPYFGHADRVLLLRNAIELARSCGHPALPALLNVIESPDGPMLIYAAADGDLVRVPAAQRADPSSSYQRFAHLPSEDLLTIFDTLIDLHRELAALGWVACDLYDGSLIVDFATLQLRVIDLDSYRRGPSVNEMGRMFGSTRFMAPEEFELGAPLDQRTTVFTLGRHLWHFTTRLTEDAEHFCGSPRQAGVIQRAVQPSPWDRYSTVAAFADAWAGARHLS